MMGGGVIIALVALYRILFAGILGSAGAGTYASSYRGGAIVGTLVVILVAVRIFLAGRLFLRGLRHVRGEATAPSHRSPVVVAVGIVVVILLAGALLSGVSAGGA